MCVQNEKKNEHDEYEIDLKIEFELNHIGKEDDIEQLHLQLICYFLHRDTPTITSPSIVLSKNKNTYILYSTIAKLSITLYMMNKFA